jgi:hypothetical protein
VQLLSGALVLLSAPPAKELACTSSVLVRSACNVYGSNRLEQAFRTIYFACPTGEFSAHTCVFFPQLGSYSHHFSWVPCKYSLARTSSQVPTRGNYLARTILQALSPKHTHVYSDLAVPWQSLTRKCFTSENSPGSILSRVVLWAPWALFCPFMVIFTALLALFKFFKLFKKQGDSLAHFSFKAAVELVISSWCRY